MVVECWAIVIIIAVMAYIMARKGRAGAAVATLPLVLVPFCHIIAPFLAGTLDSWFQSLSYNLFYAGVMTTGLVVSCVLYGMLAGNMGKKKSRRAYVLLCSGFSAILTLVLLNHTIHL
ncbi:MAG: hypothetical protein SOX72_08160 [Oscillospiraceae bacterium]|nr:hypothetical protein [Oscillospiraceae bacterium]